MYARFFTKITGGKDYTKYNNQIVEVLDWTGSGWDARYKIKFKDGTIAKNIYPTELENL